jgi:hypothetical protein
MEIRPALQGDDQIIHYFKFIGFSALRAELDQRSQWCLLQKIPSNSKKPPHTLGESRLLRLFFGSGKSRRKITQLPNNKSSWDVNWQKNYGGFDNPDPKARLGYLPRGLNPGQNPFYVALPYNDCLNHRMHKPEAARVIPWWNRINRKPGESACKGRWVQIYCAKTRRVCYAQWEDCGPLRD